MPTTTPAMIPNSIFIYMVSVLYFLQFLQYWSQSNHWMGMLVLLYSLAGIPLIMMAK